MANFIRSMTLLLVTLAFRLAASVLTDAPHVNSLSSTYSPVHPDLVKTPLTFLLDSQSTPTIVPIAQTTSSMPTAKASMPFHVNATDAPSDMTPANFSMTASQLNATTLQSSKHPTSLNSTVIPPLFNTTVRTNISHLMTTVTLNLTASVVARLTDAVSANVSSVVSPIVLSNNAVKPTITTTTKRTTTVAYEQQADVDGVTQQGSSPIFLIAVFGCVAVVVVAVVGGALFVVFRSKDDKNNRQKVNESA